MGVGREYPEEGIFRLDSEGNPLDEASLGEWRDRATLGVEGLAILMARLGIPKVLLAMAMADAAERLCKANETDEDLIERAIATMGGSFPDEWTGGDK